MSTRRTWVKVGLLYRNTMRQHFAMEGIEYTETKGFLESLFVYYPTPAQERVICNWVLRVNAN